MRGNTPPYYYLRCRSATRRVSNGLDNPVIFLRCSRNFKRHSATMPDCCQEAKPAQLRMLILFWVYPQKGIAASCPVVIRWRPVPRSFRQCFLLRLLATLERQERLHANSGNYSRRPEQCRDSHAFSDATHDAARTRRAAGQTFECDLAFRQTAGCLFRPTL